MNTTFNRTKYWHGVAGSTFPENPVLPTKEEISLGLGLITEELLELFKAGFGLSEKHTNELKVYLDGAISKVVNNINYSPTEALDALADIDVVTNRLGGVLGFDMNAASEAVYESNLSKFTIYKLEAHLAAIDYEKAGREVEVKKVIYTAPILVEGPRRGDVVSTTYYIIKDKHTGKILKAKSYKPPIFTQLNQLTTSGE